MLERNWIRTFGTILGIAGIIGALVAGQAVPRQELNAYTYAVATHYNWPLAIGGVICSLIAAAFFLALASIFEQQAMTVEELRAISNALSAAPMQQDNPAPQPRKASGLVSQYVTCSKCGEIYSKGTLYCDSCGAKLK